MGIVCAAPCCYWCPSIPCCGYEEKRNLEIHPLHHWFEMVARANPDLPLAKLRGVSSHDAGTYAISHLKCCSSVSRTQSLDLYGQLKAGSRHLDYRYGPKNKKAADGLVVQHGMHLGDESYFFGLHGVLRFLQENPNEFFILDCNKEFGTEITHEQQTYLIKYLEETFGPYSLKKEDFDTWAAAFPNISIGEILKRPNKRILLVVDRYLFNYGEHLGEKREHNFFTSKGIFKRDDMLECRWHDKGDTKEIILANSCYIRERPNQHMLFICQYILTPQSSCKDITKYIFGMDRLRVDQKQYCLLRGQTLHYAIRDAADDCNLSLVMLDFVHYEPYISHFLIGVNFTRKLNIINASIYSRGKSMDVTYRARQLVRSGNSLWVINFKRDFGLENAEGLFYVAFSFEDGAADGNAKPEEKVLVDPPFEFKSGTQYLLNNLRGKLEAARPIAEFDDHFVAVKDEGVRKTFHKFIESCSPLMSAFKES